MRYTVEFSLKSGETASLVLEREEVDLIVSSQEKDGGSHVTLNGNDLVALRVAIGHVLALMGFPNA